MTASGVARVDEHRDRRIGRKPVQPLLDLLVAEIAAQVLDELRGEAPPAVRESGELTMLITGEAL